MRPLFIGLTLAFMLCGCTQSVPTNVSVKDISYIKDTKTGLCFASIGSMTYVGFTIVSLTCVPCDALNNVEVKKK